MKHLRVGIVVLLAVIFVLAASTVWAANYCCSPCGNCCYTRCCATTCTVMKPVTVVEEVTVMKPYTYCGPCGVRYTCMKPVVVQVEKTVMQPVAVSCCGSCCCP